MGRCIYLLHALLKLKHDNEKHCAGPMQRSQASRHAGAPGPQHGGILPTTLMHSVLL